MRQYRHPDEGVRLFPCDNCGRKHWGYYEDWGAWDTGPEWDFVWTDRKGTRKDRPPC